MLYENSETVNSKDNSNNSCQNFICKSQNCEHSLRISCRVGDTMSAVLFQCLISYLDLANPNYLPINYIQQPCLQQREVLCHFLSASAVLHASSSSFSASTPTPPWSLSCACSQEERIVSRVQSSIPCSCHVCKRNSTNCLRVCYFYFIFWTIYSINLSHSVSSKETKP